jgi:hypothetical protein
MIPTPLCSFLGCGHSQLESIEELDNGLCSRHSKETNDALYFTLCCWSCGSLLETFHKESIVRGVKIKDDYVFSKNCPNCNSTMKIEELPFVTINNKTTEPSLLVNVDGILVTNKNVISNNESKTSTRVDLPK